MISENTNRLVDEITKRNLHTAESTKRWKVVISHRATKARISSNIFYIEELEELQEIVEQGPHWGTITDIVITLDRVFVEQSGPLFTQEEAMAI